MERIINRSLAGPQPTEHWRKLRFLLSLWRQRHRTRQQLATLDDHQLADVGISNSERIEELNKPFWR
ncbi:MAG: DUF1127 domain-containing protein [Pseudomonas sp.]